MKLKKFDVMAFYKTLARLDLKPGDNILLHSGIISLGKIDDVAEVFSALQTYFGEQSTIVVPTFTLWLDDGVVYKCDTPSQRMGAMAEYVRMHPDAVRSRCPMHNHAAIGPLSYLFKEISGHYSTGVGSDFELFHVHRFKNLFLGCSPKSSGTYLIHLESIAQVPYRTWITLQKPVQWDSSITESVTCHYFARDKTFNNKPCDTVGVRVNLGAFEELLLEHGVLQEEELPYGKAYCGNILDIRQTILNGLSENPLLALE